MDAAEFEKRSQDILGTLDARLGKIKQAARVPVSVQASEKACKVADISLLIGVPLLMASLVFPSGGPLYAAGAAVATGELTHWLKEMRHKGAIWMSRRMLRMVGKDAPAASMEMAYLRGVYTSLSAHPPEIKKAMDRHLDPDAVGSASTVTSYMEAIDRALKKYDVLLDHKREAERAQQILEEEGLLPHARSLVSSQALSDAVDANLPPPPAPRTPRRL